MTVTETKEQAAVEAIEKARQYVAKMAAPSRTRISEALECNIENYESFFGHPLADEEDPYMALLGEIPLPLEDMGGDLLLTKKAVSESIEILAVEVRALKETVAEQGEVMSEIDRLTPSYFADTADKRWTAGENLFNEAVGKVYEGESGFDLGTDLEDSGGLRVCEARAYGIALGASDMVRHWKDHLDNPHDHLRAIRSHLSQLMVALADLEEKIR
jgi:hypothetical protein